MLKVAKTLPLTGIVILGDFGDFVSVTSHSKSPKQRQVALVDELAACNTALSELDELDVEDRIYIMGNHEDRIDRYINDRCPEMAGLIGTDLKDSLHLRDRGYQVIPYRDHYYHDGVWYTHDTGSAGLNAHRSSLNRYQDTVVIGHTHRMGFEVKNTIHGTPIIGFMAGWLGDAKACAGYAHTSATATDWTLGFGIARNYYGTAHIEPVVFDEGYNCFAHGRFFIS